MTGTVVTPLASIPLASDTDVFTARQLGRDLAIAIGLDRLDVTRVATAISELAREAAPSAGDLLTFEIRSGIELVARLTITGLAEDHPSIRSARRLVDQVGVTVTDAGLHVVLIKAATSALSGQEVARLRELATRHTPSRPLEELRRQNQELLATLEALQAQNTALERLNDELEETNRGVMALYAELSGELDRTNQGVVALYAEIDDKNAQLSAASEAKSRFLRSISHELRTPVNSVLGLARLLADPGGAPLTAEQAEQVDYIRASATDLSTLVDELLDLAKAESGRLEPVVQDVDVAGLLDDLRAKTVPLLRDGVTLELPAVPPGSVIRTDPELLRHVLRNLLSNAAKFTLTGTVTVTIDTGPTATGPTATGPTATGTGGGVRIGVTDTGVGMSEEDRAQVFEEFFQAKTPLHADTKGTGLGLPFALRVAESLGGGIDVTSAPGAGSSFTLYLPGPDLSDRAEEPAP